MLASNCGGRARSGVAAARIAATPPPTLARLSAVGVRYDQVVSHTASPSCDQVRVRVRVRVRARVRVRVRLRLRVRVRVRHGVPLLGVDRRDRDALDRRLGGLVLAPPG